MDRPTLILDADDTLWDNNVFYERAIDDFAYLMAREGFDRAEARRLFVEVEYEQVRRAGYAAEVFVRSMSLAYRRLCEQHDRRPSPEVEQEAEAVGRRVIGYPINLLKGVAETLPCLHRRCRLILLTKGDVQAQQDKIDRSGLASYFEAVHVVPEKGPQVLQDLVDRHGLDHRRTWMVGNSPRSDVNPALEIGIGAVYIPYHMPWAFEDEPITGPERVVTLQSFDGLLDLFPAPEEGA